MDVYECIRKWSKKHGSKQLNRLIKEHTPMINSMAYKYTHKKNVMYDDLVAEGLVGFLMALCRYDMNYNTKLNTYAFYWIKAKMSRYLSKHIKATGKSYERILESNIPVDQKLDIETNHNDKNLSMDHIYDSYKNTFYAALRSVTLLQQSIISMRWLEGEKKTFREIATLLGYSRQHIQREEKKALTIIKEYVKSKFQTTKQMYQVY